MTLRELLWMAEGKGRSEWSHTSALLALLANCHRDPKKTRPFKPADFSPYTRTKRQAPGAPAVRIKDLSILKQVFVDRKPLDLRNLEKDQPCPRGYRH